MKTIKTTAGLLVTGALLLPAAAADAKPVCDVGGVRDECPKQLTQMPIKVWGTFNGGGKARVPVYSAPSKGAIVTRYVRHGAPALIVCQTIGRRVSGPFGTGRLWNGLKRGGYVSDTHVYTGSDGRATGKRC